MKWSEMLILWIDSLPISFVLGTHAYAKRARDDEARANGCCMMLASLSWKIVRAKRADRCLRTAAHDFA